MNEDKTLTQLYVSTISTVREANLSKIMNENEDGNEDSRMDFNEDICKEDFEKGYEKYVQECKETIDLCLY